MQRRSATARIAFFSVVTLTVAVVSSAQPRFYAGGTVGVVSQAQKVTTEQLGGATWSGSALVGVEVSPHLRVEFEPSFGGEFHGQDYTYRPSPSLVAHVTSKGRDTFFTFQVRGRTGAFEPVAGVSYVRSRTARHAAFVPGDVTYFHDETSENTVALAAGIDVAIRVASRLSIVPTFRAFAILRPAPSASSTRIAGAPFVLRYGAGARVSF